ncbi:hypothetical protein AzCIB_4321 [Azoarcus sp. CIB]|uniref:hypothetical protein n=1 Tax=Aromatoleum sp. (strain CIB) TaxID=198107 RepID=UPI00067A89A0|nr:hypothetical protein [Azoarcus sp. CIB]AKU14214.1 hypothetical protein AzCIB_4321 [Azoarcus sp. CIB]
MEPLSERAFPASPRGRRAEAGVVLLIALIILVLMSLAAASVIRSTDTGTLVAGNLAFRQATMYAGDIAINRAVEELQSGAFTARTYYRSAFYFKDAAGKPNFKDAGRIASDAIWESTAVPCIDENGRATNCATDSGNYRIQYVIERQCKSDPVLTDGEDIRSKCTVDPETVALAAADAFAKKSGSTVPPIEAGKLDVYYRVIIRARGPRGGVNFYEAMLAAKAQPGA